MVTILSTSILWAGLVAVIVAVYYFYQYMKLKQQNQYNELEIAHSKQFHKNFFGYMVEFSEALKEEGNVVDSGLRCLGKYLAGRLNADAIGIYENIDGELKGVGMYGSYPLLHVGNEEIFTEYRLMLAMLKQESYPLGVGVLGRAAKERQFEFIADGASDPRLDDYIGANRTKSIMIAPISRRDGELVGVICAVRSKNTRQFGAREEEVFRQITGQIILSRDFIGAFTEIAKKQQLDKELEFVRQIQDSLLPQSFPDWEQFSVTAFTRPAKEVNGDFYDFVELDENRMLIVIGDASGKGLPASMLTAMTRSVIRAVSDKFSNLTDFLHEVNYKLYRNSDRERFVTLGCCLIDRRNSLLEFGRAGHTDLLTFVHHHIRVISPDGTALGIIPEEFARFDTLCLAIDPGTSVLMYSDGITEALNAQGEEFGIVRLQEAFSAGCENETLPENVLERIIGEVEQFSIDQDDDQTLVMIRSN